MGEDHQVNDNHTPEHEDRDDAEVTAVLPLDEREHTLSLDRDELEQSGAEPSPQDSAQDHAQDTGQGPQSYAPPAPGSVPVGRPAPGYAGPGYYAPQSGQLGQHGQHGPGTGMPPTQRPDAGQYQGMGGYGGYGPGERKSTSPNP